MKRMKTCAVFAAALFGMCAGSAYAEETVVAKVPFPFAVRGQQFTAGHYSVTTEQGVVTIRGIDNGGAVVAMTVSTGGADPIGDQPALMFVRYENEYRLAKIWPSSTEGLTIQDPSVVEHSASAAFDPPAVMVAASAQSSLR